MRYRLKIEVSLKPGHSDPEGEATRNLLKELGYKVAGVNVSKEYIVILHAASKTEARRKPRKCAKDFCKPD